MDFMPSSRPEDSPDHKAPVMASATPTAGLRAEFLDEIAYYQQRNMRLAEAMPVENYTWRPAGGVRSAGEVFTHIPAANYGIAGALGTAPPAGFDFKAITALSDAGKPQKMFNRQTTLRGSFLIITGHFGEHLGQSIAYARMNGIVPPWTEKAQQQQ